ncbi:hypothetical protein K435DRAFT_784705, partial [Dendrothele bispora CBS 962.96]
AASFKGNEGIVKFLLDAGADVNAQGGADDHRGQSRDTIHYDSRSFGTINGKYTENDNRSIRRNIENAQNYYGNQGDHDNFGWNTSVMTAQQRPPPNQIAQSNRLRKNDNSRLGIRFDSVYLLMSLLFLTWSIYIYYWLFLW